MVEHGPALVQDYDDPYHSSMVKYSSVFVAVIQ